MRARLVNLGLCVLLAGWPCAAESRQRPATFQVSVTAYCVEGKTDSGRQTRPGLVAADPRVLPLGTVVTVRGLRRPHNGTYTVADTGRAIKGRELDIFMADCRAARKFGRQPATVRVVRRAK